MYCELFYNATTQARSPSSSRVWQVVFVNRARGSSRRGPGHAVVLEEVLASEGNQLVVGRMVYHFLTDRHGSRYAADASRCTDESRQSRCESQSPASRRCHRVHHRCPRKTRAQTARPRHAVPYGRCASGSFAPAHARRRTAAPGQTDGLSRPLRGRGSCRRFLL